jgi:hypothetical protein
MTWNLKSASRQLDYAHRAASITLRRLFESLAPPNQLAYSTLRNHTLFTFIVDQLMAHIVQKRKFSLPATYMLRIACHYETQSLRSVTKYLALVPCAERITLRCVFESLAPPKLLVSNCFDGRFHEEAIDHVAATSSQHKQSRP